MGLSRQGLYVDAPNGRTYLYLLGASQVPGARFERRGPLFGARVIDRGALELRPFVEGLLAPAALGRPAHETQAQLDRTRLSGMLQLGDGLLGNERVEVTLTGRAQGRNRIALTAAVVGHEVVARLPELSASGARFHALGRSGRCGALSGKLSVSLAGRSATLAADEINLADLAIGDPPA
jgi:hypothetical protein